ncbi:hypothetical protein ES703_113530 [subsurface metagenome]
MVVDNLSKLPNRSLAVIEFLDLDGNPITFGSLLAERVITRIVQYSEIKVIERNLIHEILKEQELSVSGITETENAKRIGGLLNVDALVTGIVIQLKNYYEVSVRMIDTQSGLILSAITLKLLSEPTRGAQISGGAISVESKKIEKKSKPAVLHAPRVEVIESSMEKIKDGLGDNYTIRITGAAKYIPSSDNDQSFSDLLSDVEVHLLDASGRKVMGFKSIFTCGEYGHSENILPYEPFPFEAEDPMVKKELWEKIESHKVIKWYFIR